MDLREVHGTVRLNVVNDGLNKQGWKVKTTERNGDMVYVRPESANKPKRTLTKGTDYFHSVDDVSKYLRGVVLSSKETQLECIEISSQESKESQAESQESQPLPPQAHTLFHGKGSEDLVSALDRVND